MAGETSASASLNSIEPVASSIAATRRIEVTILRDLESLGSYAATWNSLCLQRPDCLPQSTHAMVSSWLSHRLKPEDTWMVLVAKSEGKAIGFLPLIIHPYKRFGITILTISPPNDTQIMSVDMVCELGAESAVLGAFLRTVNQEYASFPQIEMYRIPEGSFTHKALVQHPTGHMVRTRPCGNAAYYEIKGTYDEYLDALKPNFSRNLRRLQRKIEAMSDCELTSHTGNELTEDLLERFLELEASGWKGQERGAILSYPTAAAYYREAFSKLRELGLAQLYTMQFNGKLIAAQLGARMGRRIYLFKISYNEEFSSLGPGNVLMAKTIERAFQSGDVDEINCLTDTNWHTNWVVSRRPYTAYAFIPWRPVPLVTRAFWLTTNKIKGGIARLF